MMFIEQRHAKPQKAGEKQVAEQQQRTDPVLMDAVSVEEILYVTLRHLTMGNSYDKHLKNLPKSPNHWPSSFTVYREKSDKDFRKVQSNLRNSTIHQIHISVSASRCHGIQSMMAY
jgi:hypothetical protein